MKLEQLASKSTTSLDLVHPVTGDPIGVTIEGHTPDSSEWEQARKAIVGNEVKASIVIEKNKQKVEVDNSMADKNRKLLIAVISDIKGIDDWTYSDETKAALFKNPNYNWMFEQWRDHLDDRSNFF